MPEIKTPVLFSLDSNHKTGSGLGSMLLRDDLEDKSTIVIKSLRQQVYEYLRDEINRGYLVSGAQVNLSTISQKLGISKTPLRDALIQLECDGFVTIQPRRGVTVTNLSIEDIQNSWELCKALESEAMYTSFHKISDSSIRQMEKVNKTMKEVSTKKDFDRYYMLNVDFHNIFLDLSENDELKNIVSKKKQRLYDFQKRTHLREWEVKNCKEHDHLIELVKQNDRDAAVSFIRDVHWAFDQQKNLIQKFYFDKEDDWDQIRF